MFNFMHNISSYEDTVKDFSWKIAEEELGYKPGDVINIGEYCTDRICRNGKAYKLALIWQGHKGEVKNIRLTICESLQIQ